MRIKEIFQMVIGIFIFIISINIIPITIKYNSAFLFIVFFVSGYWSVYSFAIGLKKICNF